MLEQTPQISIHQKNPQTPEEDELTAYSFNELLDLNFRLQAELQRRQYTGFSIKHGHVGYLREAYHGEPYATRVLVPEAFDHDAYPDGAPIPAKTLRERLPDTLAAATRRQQLVYNEGPEREMTRIVLQSFSDFVALCERKEHETGEPCSIVASY